MVKKGELTDAEKAVGQALKDLQDGNVALKEALTPLYVSKVSEVEIDSDRSAYVLFVPCTMLTAWRKISKTLIDELEKKFIKHHVLIVANRTMIKKEDWAKKTKFSGIRPRSRTLKAVYEAILDDICYPSEIVAKRTRVKVDGAKLLKVFLNPKDATQFSEKITTFNKVYQILTKRGVAFEFASTH